MTKSIVFSSVAVKQKRNDLDVGYRFKNYTGTKEDLVDSAPKGNIEV